MRREEAAGCSGELKADCRPMRGRRGDKLSFRGHGEGISSGRRDPDWGGVLFLMRCRRILRTCAEWVITAMAYMGL